MNRSSSVSQVPQPQTGRSAPALESTQVASSGVDASSKLPAMIWGLCIFAVTSPFFFTLTGADPTAVVMRNAQTMRTDEASQYLFYVVRGGVLLVALIMSLTAFRATLRQSWLLLPVLPFVVWTGMSAMWADQPATTLHGVATLIAALLAGYLFARGARPETVIRSVVFGAFVTALTCYVFIFLLPTFGLHQYSDVSQGVHAGAWRGVYQHKNFLGQIAATFLAALLFVGRAVLPAWWRWTLIALLAVLIGFSISASALAIPPVTYVLVWTTMIAGNKTRSRALLLTLPIVVGGYFAMGAILTALGRDASFSGRDVVWSQAFDAIQDRMLAGYGFVSLSYGDFAYKLVQTTGLVDPHSAYLDLLLGTGIVGLLLFLIPITAAWRACSRAVQAGGVQRDAALTLYAMTVAWLIASFTESNDRPLTAMGGIGLFSIAALLAVPAWQRAIAPTRRFQALQMRA
jgi:exopolysaccharide production protein ExoQ